MLHLQNVSMVYNSNVHALNNINLSFRRGQFTVLLGQSGAGKSTLLRCLNLLSTPTTGQVIGDDDHPLSPTLKNPKQLREHRRNTGMVFQMHQLILRQTALRNVLIGSLGAQSLWQSFLPASRKRLDFALHCLDRVGLLHKAQTRCDQLSGGERQRVGIARALAQRPRFLLADEPVASLDPGTATKVLNLIKTVCEQDNITAIVSLHQVELAKAYAQRIIALANGHVTFDGMASELSDDNLDQLYQTNSHTPKEQTQEQLASITPLTIPHPSKEIEDEIQMAKRFQNVVGSTVLRPVPRKHR